MAVESNNTNLFDFDVFSQEQRKYGAVTLHILGVLYMFLALAIVCDEFFIPSLEVIINRFHISKDVAGATFMAAGGSAPELFTSVVDVFVSNNGVGIGTIVGSAVFNILFVIGMCAIFSKTLLILTWWPLFRDVTFYSVSLIALIVIFVDQRVHWYEAVVLLSCYVLYVTFMKFDSSFERITKSTFGCGEYKISSEGPSETNSLPTIPEVESERERENSISIKPHTSLGTVAPDDLFSIKPGLVSILIGTLDPAESATNPTSLASRIKSRNKRVGDSAAPSEQTIVESVQEETEILDPSRPQSVRETRVDPKSKENVANGVGSNVDSAYNNLKDPDANSTSVPKVSDDYSEEKPLDISWPVTLKKQVIFVIIAPIILLLWLSLPDVRNKPKEKWYPVSFLGSIIWIAGFSWLMNWWAYTIVKTWGFHGTVMGLVILSAGTSIPDLFTSVIVARKGYGDMAVSSSLGSNLFDVTMGLPLPWLIYALYQKKGYGVQSEGMLCLVLLLFCMLIVTIVIIAASGWKMHKGLGIWMLFMYLLFLVLSVLINTGRIPCDT